MAGAPVIAHQTWGQGPDHGLRGSHSCHAATFAHSLHILDSVKRRDYLALTDFQIQYLGFYSRKLTLFANVLQCHSFAKNHYPVPISEPFLQETAPFTEWIKLAWALLFYSRFL